MKLTFDQFILKTNILDKILITLIFFFPLFLSISIFVADLSASIIAIIILQWLIEDSMALSHKKQLLKKAKKKKKRARANA